jgi:hypothetical protein
MVILATTGLTLASISRARRAATVQLRVFSVFGLRPVPSGKVLVIQMKV